MINVPLNDDSYIYWREWARTQDYLLWRDLGPAAIVPAWDECVCRLEDMVGPYTPGQLAYLTLKAHYPTLQLRWRKEEMGLLKTRPPKLFDPYQGDIYCLDIVSAYAQLYRCLYLHNDWPFKRPKYPLQGIAEALMSEKKTRNAIVGIARSTHNKWCQGERVWRSPKKNNYLSPTLWGQLMGLLNQAALLMKGAIFVNTDGYAFKTLAEREKGRQRLEDYGLTVRIFEGEGEITGINSLVIPGVKMPKEITISDPVAYFEPSKIDFLDHWRKQNDRRIWKR
jgi:hypothetical protein